MVVNRPGPNTPAPYALASWLIGCPAAEEAIAYTEIVSSPAALLQLMWLASPSLPIGGFSYSEGLEGAIESGAVRTEKDVTEWLTQQLHISLVRSEMAVLVQTFCAWRSGEQSRVEQLNDWVLHTRETAELRLQTEQMGRSLTEWMRNQHLTEPNRIKRITVLSQLSEGRPTYPVAFALAASFTEASLPLVLLAFAFGWAENMVQAAIKAVPLGQSAGSRILARLAQDIPSAAACAQSLPDHARQSFSPMLAIISSQHEHQYSRLFRS